MGLMLFGRSFETSKRAVVNRMTAASIFMALTQ
jgi:hypothetical protein